MPSRSRNLQPLLAALTSAGVPVNLNSIANSSGANTLEVTVNAQSSGALRRVGGVNFGGVTAPYSLIIGNQTAQVAQEPTTSELQIVQHVGSTGIDPRKTDPGTADSLDGSAKVTGPGAGATILAGPTPGTGHYEVYVWAGVFGTFTTADVGNMFLDKTGTTQGGIANPTGAVMQFGPWRIPCNSTDTLNVKANVAGGGAAVYVAQILASRLN